MFSDAILVKIFSDDRLNGIPLEYQSTVVHVVEDVTDLISDMTPEERTLAKSKLATLINKM